MSTERPKRCVTKEGKLLGCYAPLQLVEAIYQWIERDPERDVSTFIREAAREKLHRDGIEFNEHTT